jgi:hypothetical protein
MQCGGGALDGSHDVPFGVVSFPDHTDANLEHYGRRDVELRPGQNASISSIAAPVTASEHERAAACLAFRAAEWGRHKVPGNLPAPARGNSFPHTAADDGMFLPSGFPKRACLGPGRPGPDAAIGAVLPMSFALMDRLF